MSHSRVLLTGANGFLGGHVVHQLLSRGYFVRAIVRSGRGESLLSAYANFGTQLEVATVDNLISGDLSTVLEGIHSVIHAAAPLSGRPSKAEKLDVEIEGNLNIFRQAYNKGIRKFAYVSSIATINALTSDPDYNDTTWVDVSKEVALSGKKGPFYIYLAQKVLSERAIWEFVDQHRDVDVTVVNPPFFFGPFAPSYPNPDASKSSLGTNSMIYALIQPEGGIPMHPSWVNVRDVAQALVNALQSPPASQVGRKRIPLSGEWFSFKDAVAYIVEVRPELKNRISEKAKTAPPVPETQIDTTRAREVLGVEFTAWRKTVIDTIDSLVELEKDWERNGALLH
ncbi:NAD(P)-binding domain superfamily protein [Abortiporus biennis]